MEPARPSARRHAPDRHRSHPLGGIVTVLWIVLAVLAIGAGLALLSIDRGRRRPEPPAEPVDPYVEPGSLFHSRTVQPEIAEDCCDGRGCDWCRSDQELHPERYQ